MTFDIHVVLFVEDNSLGAKLQFYGAWTYVDLTLM